MNKRININVGRPVVEVGLMNEEFEIVLSDERLERLATFESTYDEELSNVEDLQTAKNLYKTYIDIVFDEEGLGDRVYEFYGKSTIALGEVVLGLTRGLSDSMLKYKNNKAQEYFD